MMKVIPHKTKKISATLIIDADVLIKGIVNDRLNGIKRTCNTRGEYQDVIVDAVCGVLDTVDTESAKFQVQPAYSIQCNTKYEYNPYSVVISAIPNPEKYATPRRIDEFVNKCKDIMLTIADAFEQSSIDIEISDVLVHTYVHK